MNRLIKIIPLFMLTFFMWAIGFTFNPVQNVVPTSQIELEQKNKTSDFSHFNSVEVEEGAFVIFESEPEFEVELDWISISTKSANFKSTRFTESSNSYSNHSFFSKKTIPLYDLFCIWKFHLS